MAEVSTSDNQIQVTFPFLLLIFGHRPAGAMLLMSRWQFIPLFKRHVLWHPMIVVPFAHDQPDNAARITRLGVGRTISRSNYKAARVAKELREILLNPFYVKRAYQIGHRVRCENGAALAVSQILDRLNERESNRVALRTVA